MAAPPPLVAFRPAAASRVGASPARTARAAEEVGPRRSSLARRSTGAGAHDEGHDLLGGAGPRGSGRIRSRRAACRPRCAPPSLLVPGPGISRVKRILAAPSERGPDGPGAAREPPARTRRGRPVRARRGPATPPADAPRARPPRRPGLRARTPRSLRAGRFWRLGRSGLAYPAPGSRPVVRGCAPREGAEAIGPRRASRRPPLTEGAWLVQGRDRER